MRAKQRTGKASDNEGRETSGGVDGARHGACLMTCGEPAEIDRVESNLLDLAMEGGYVHAVPSGAGHFKKLVRNGIEFGMPQAIGEGVDLLQHYGGGSGYP